MLYLKIKTFSNISIWIVLRGVPTKTCSRCLVTRNIYMKIFCDKFMMDILYFWSLWINFQIYWFINKLYTSMLYFHNGYFKNEFLPNAMMRTIIIIISSKKFYIKELLYIIINLISHLTLSTECIVFLQWEGNSLTHKNNKTFKGQQVRRV